MTAETVLHGPWLWIPGSRFARPGMTGRAACGGGMPRPSLLTYPKRQELLVLGRVLERIAGLIEEVRDVDRGERIGAFDDQNVAWREAAERLADPERRQRAFEAAQIEDFLGHEL